MNMYKRITFFKKKIGTTGVIDRNILVNGDFSSFLAHDKASG